MNLRRFLTAWLLTVFAAGLPAAPAQETRAKGAKPQHISQGQEVKLADYLVPGKTMIFDFYSDYCPPCKAIAPHVEKLHATRDDLVVVTVDINRPGVKGIDWKSPVARQYELRSIPHFKVFGPNGKLIAEGQEARTMVQRWLQ